MHKGQDQVTFVEVYPGIAVFFSRLYILLYIHMQNLLNWADRASTVPNRSSNEFSGKNGALPAQTMTIPVTTGVNRDATVLNLGLYRPITGANRGGCLQRARLIMVESWTLRVSSRLNTVFDSIPGDSRWLPVVFNILEQPGHEPVQHCSSWFAKVVHYCDMVLQQFIPDNKARMKRPLRYRQWEEHDFAQWSPLPVIQYIRPVSPYLHARG